MSSKKIGRPIADDPKSFRFSIRLDKATIDFLDEYCKEQNIKRTEAIRKGIYKLKNDDLQ